MLHDSFQGPAGRIVDADAAREFMKEATKLASASELETIGERLEKKSAVFREYLSIERIAELEEPDLRRILRRIFTLRRKTSRVLERNGLLSLRREISLLVHGEDLVGDRIERFARKIEGFEASIVVGWATELLHFHSPGSHWLWTPWIWNPKNGSGSLPLIIHDAEILRGKTESQRYMAVGKAIHEIALQGRQIGYLRAGRGLFEVDVFLACVYAIYMYTVFRMKLSDEFNRILPELPELVERVLGVHQAEMKDES